MTDKNAFQLATLDYVELIQRLGNRIYPIMNRSAFDALAKGPLSPELRRLLYQGHLDIAVI